MQTPAFLLDLNFSMPSHPPQSGCLLDLPSLLTITPLGEPPLSCEQPFCLFLCVLAGFWNRALCDLATSTEKALAAPRARWHYHLVENHCWWCSLLTFLPARHFYFSLPYSLGILCTFWHVFFGGRRKCLAITFYSLLLLHRGGKEKALPNIGHPGM